MSGPLIGTVAIAGMLAMIALRIPIAVAMFIAGVSDIEEAPINDHWTIPGQETLLPTWQAEDTRLFNEVRSRQGLAYSVGSSSGTGFRNPGLFVAFTIRRNFIRVISAREMTRGEKRRYKA